MQDPGAIAGKGLVPVLAWLPPCGDLADRRTPNEELRRIWAQDAHQRLQDTLNLASGHGVASAARCDWSTRSGLGHSHATAKQVTRKPIAANVPLTDRRLEGITVS
jgi:hypothetical protein